MGWIRVTTFEDSIKNRQYAAASAILVKYSAEALKDMGINMQQVQRVRAIQLETAEKTGEIFRTITQLLAFAERLLFFSPQELGQVAPREITATEANMVQNTTLGIRDFHTVGIEEGLAAKKRIIYSAAMAFGSDEVTLSVQNRFSTPTASSPSPATSRNWFTIIPSAPATDSTVRLHRATRRI